VRRGMRKQGRGTRCQLAVRVADRPTAAQPRRSAAAASGNARRQGETLTHACELYAPVMCPALRVPWLLASLPPRPLLSPLPFPRAPLRSAAPRWQSVRSPNPHRAQQQRRAAHTKHIRAIRSGTCFCLFPAATSSCAAGEAASVCLTACPYCNLCPPQPRRSLNCPVNQQRRHHPFAALA
jgi:hypothetical protein